MFGYCKFYAMFFDS